MPADVSQNEMKYQRFLKPGFKPFDPLELAKATEKIVTRKGKEGLGEEQIDAYDTTLKRLKAFTGLEFASKLEKMLKGKQI